MVTNEETSFATDKIQAKAEKKMANQNGNGWQSVTIGGVTGILMGAGAMYAAEAFSSEATQEEEVINGTNGEEVASAKEEVASSHVATNGLKVAEVDQNLSFGQAFEAARDAVGPGGVFHWHGGIYNTYRLEEWNAMSDGERAQFAQLVQPEVQPGEGRVRHGDDDVAQRVQDEPVERKPEVNKPKPDEPRKPEPDEPEKQDEDGDIHFLGFTNVEVDGQTYQAGHVSAKIEGEERHVYYIDVDNAPNNEFERMVSDYDGDGKLTMAESVDVSERHITVEEFALMSALDEANRDSEGGTGQVALNSQDNIAPDMPDYVNDANTTI